MTDTAPKLTESSTELSTPMMRQYLEIKRRYPDDILFFRMGDFYEMFLDDAVYASKILDIALTQRQDKIPMCGIPYHSVNNYIHYILDAGKNIAICEQVEDAKNVTGRIVKRDVTRVITPGSIFEEDLLSANERRLIAAIQKEENKVLILLADVSTTELYFQKKTFDELEGFFESRQVKEVITHISYEEADNLQIQLVKRNYPLNDKANKTTVQEMFQLKNVDPLELSLSEIKLAAFFYNYIKEIAPQFNIRFQTPRNEYKQKIMYLDDSAIKTLEILRDQSGKRRASLSAVIDKTMTSAGKRKLEEILSAPSFDVKEIKERHDTVDFFYQNNSLRKEIQNLLKNCCDVQRLLNAIQNEPRVRHLGMVYHTLKSISEIQTTINKEKNIPPYILKNWKFENAYPENLNEELENALYLENLPPLLDERRFVNPGYSSVLDELFEINESAHHILKKFESDERKKWDISTLKIKYNKVIGYYIEISRGLAEKAPSAYVRRQTLVNAERFTCEELKELENKILNAKDDILTLQKSIFNTLVQKVVLEIENLWQWGDRISYLDVFISFAETARKQQYIRPVMVEKGVLSLKDSRHPVVEEIFREEIFVPNDIELDNDNRHLAVLTGPNMSGKSTFIRQVGLIQILAQAGSFVPAKFAQIPVADRIFTRIGSFDRLFQGESTFYVEMSECARIFQNFTSQSLILLDEVGRGTSTFDGISIARAMIEYLNREDKGRPKTLFATHYAELSEMIEADKGIIGLTVQVLEEADKVVFLRKIIEGRADKSYGIHVAEMAGMPVEITARAVELLKELETEGLWKQEPVFQVIDKNFKKTLKPKNRKNQLSMFSDNS
ncbi:MAG: DNA mismatch repair protein MutS [Spirochaetia bacterium]|nr:DNA mismatch repair protein MutS [Spirochaetia bacterium]